MFLVGGVVLDNPVFVAKDVVMVLRPLENNVMTEIQILMMDVLISAPSFQVTSKSSSKPKSNQSKGWSCIIEEQKSVCFEVCGNGTLICSSHIYKVYIQDTEPSMRHVMMETHSVVMVAVKTAP